MELKQLFNKTNSKYMSLLIVPYGIETLMHGAWSIISNIF